MIGGNVEVVILGTDGGQVRVGIRAPRDITVLRKELIQQVEQENRLAASAAPATTLESLIQKSAVRPPTPVR